MYRAGQSDDVDVHCAQYFVNSSLALVVLFRRRLRAVADVLKGIRSTGFTQSRWDALLWYWCAVCRHGPCGPLSSLRPWDNWIPPDLHGFHKWVFDSLGCSMISSRRLSFLVGILGFVSGLGAFGRIQIPDRMFGCGLILFLLFLSLLSRILRLSHLAFWLNLILLMLSFVKLGCLFFCRSGLPQELNLDLSRTTGRHLQEVARAKKSTVGGLDGWAWNEIKALPLPWFSGLAVILKLVETTGIWPQGLLDAFFALIPEADGDSTPLGQRLLSVLFVVYRLWASLRLGHLREWVEEWLPKSVFSLSNGLSSVEAWFSTALDIEQVLSGAGGDQLHVMVADVIKSFDTVDRSILDCALGRLGFPDWFRKVYFSFDGQVRLRFKLAAGLGEPWCRDGGIPQGCPLSMVFIVALYGPWCRHLDALPDVPCLSLLVLLLSMFGRLVRMSLSWKVCPSQHF